MGYGVFFFFLFAQVPSSLVPDRSFILGINFRNISDLLVQFDLEMIFGARNC
jgi:hypothetical protein